MDSNGTAKENNHITKIFISYSHDTPEHKERVFNLSERLKKDLKDPHYCCCAY